MIPRQAKLYQTAARQARISTSTVLNDPAPYRPHEEVGASRPADFTERTITGLRIQVLMSPYPSAKEGDDER